MTNRDVRLVTQLSPEFASILTPEALNFVVDLHEKFNDRRQVLLLAREKTQKAIDRGTFPDFLPSTESIRSANWKVAPIPADLMDRRVEITGPPDRKMVINALNSGAKVFMADLEDSHAPTWAGTLQGQINLYDAVRKQIRFVSPEGKSYELNPKTATLVVRPRGWHMVEKKVLLNGKPLSASLFDFGLYLFHNAGELLRRGTGPYFYLPKLESHHEARLWNDVFLYAQERLDLPKSTIRATVLIETILAAFEMDEILYELKDHCVGLNCGRWDYIFSYIKKFRNHPEFVLPDRAQVTMNQPFLKSYYQLLIQTCHRRGAFAMGGMAAQIPIKNDVQANQIAMDKVRADKEREVNAGHDGTWVAHPGLVGLATEIFDSKMPGPNQLANLREDVRVSGKNLLEVPQGEITEAGLRNNISVGLQYLESWLRGSGCVPIFNLMEDAATAEISRAQIWQWIRHPKGVLSDGRRVSPTLFNQFLEEELNTIRQKLGDTEMETRRFGMAKEIFSRISTAPEFTEFLTLSAYDALNE